MSKRRRSTFGQSVTNFFESVAEPFSSAAETTGEVLGLVGLITGQPELEAVALGLEVASKATKRNKNPATQPSNFGATSVRDPNAGVRYRSTGTAT